MSRLIMPISHHPGEQEFEVLVTEGRVMIIDEAIAYTLEDQRT